MTTFTDTWNAAFEGLPPDTVEPALQGASRIRSFKKAVRERMEVDHSLAGDADDGAHKKMTMIEQGSDPSAVANRGFVYTKDVSGITELFYRDSAGNIAQITAGGLLKAQLPVGSIHISVDSTNPATTLGYGTWTAFGAGRMLISLDSGNTLFDTPEETGGSANAIVVTHNHGVTDPGHTHTGPTGVTSPSADTPIPSSNLSVFGTHTTSSNTTGISIQNAGSSGTNANYPPFIAVYMWKRTA